MVRKEVVALIPVVVAVVSASPPLNELGLVLSEGKVEEIIPMKRLKIDWAPYVPLDKRVDKEGSEIFVLSCKQRRAALKHKNVKGNNDLLKFEYAVPYLDPAAKVKCHEVPVQEEEYFSANDDELEELYFSGDDENQVIEEDDEKNVMVEEEAKGENIDLGVREGGRRRSVENIMKMRIYKFYPVQTPDTPDISEFKNAFVNRYYGTAHEIL
ncbi:protein HEAT INTOLERANT 4-like [Rosa rugosa]|uniref:protein HEAT INTOLERANT 4-like n=1 Tax=Rosa rugosa TaxID=74645 RepID=UPI002B406215|nr:protein HEAT INTOLERANT 4-like [Rosa rugosa]